jgi:hypothetical protein
LLPAAAALILLGLSTIEEDTTLLLVNISFNVYIQL